MTYKSQHVSVSINCPADEIYEFTSNPGNLPSWAVGLSGSIACIEGEWIAESPMGSVTVKFADRNTFGVLDHDVTLPSGEMVYNPVRVVPNDDGCEMIFTVYRRAGVTDQMFTADVEAVTRDLRQLKRLMEE